MFGEHNEDEDVSPDTADPEAAASAGDAALNQESNNEVIFKMIFYFVLCSNREFLFFLGKCESCQYSTMGTRYKL